MACVNSRTVSPAAQALLKKFTSRPMVMPPAPSDAAGWKARQLRFQEGRGREALRRALQRAEGITIETGTMAGVDIRTVRLHRKLRGASVDAELHVFEGMWHGFYGIAELPEAADALDEVVGFFNRSLGLSQN